MPKFEMIGGCSSWVLQIQSDSCDGTWHGAYREFPEDKVARVPKAEITRPMQTLADVPTLAHLSSGLVFLCLGCPDLAEVDFNIRRELHSWPMERPGFLLR